MNEPVVVAIGDGTSNTYDLTFGYIRRDHVHAYIGGDEVELEWINSTRVSLAVVASTGQTVTIRRETPEVPITIIQNNKPLAHMRASI